ncbi:tripartite tricarboxylate transporter TctB family protein [Arsenicitalea aurantiaca]|nr:tripartite tricarboxylate transporter TctB family protein [Arsenicitalea aurantiaca]
MLKVSDLGSGLAIAGLGLAIIVQAQGFPSVGASPVSPAFYPGLIGTVLLGCGLALALGSLLKKEAMPLGVLPEWLRRPGNILAVLAVPAAIIAYGLLSPVLGFLATAFLVTLGLLVAFRVNWLWSLGTAFVLSGLLHLVFVVLMRVPLPYGFIEALLP